MKYHFAPRKPFMFAPMNGNRKGMFVTDTWKRRLCEECFCIIDRHDRSALYCEDCLDERNAKSRKS